MSPYDNKCFREKKRLDDYLPNIQTVAVNIIINLIEGNLNNEMFKSNYNNNTNTELQKDIVWNGKLTKLDNIDLISELHKSINNNKYEIKCSNDDEFYEILDTLDDTQIVKKVDDETKNSPKCEDFSNHYHSDDDSDYDIDNDVNTPNYLQLGGLDKYDDSDFDIDAVNTQINFDIENDITQFVDSDVQDEIRSIISHNDDETILYHKIKIPDKYTEWDDLWLTISYYNNTWNINETYLESSHFIEYKTNLQKQLNDDIITD